MNTIKTSISCENVISFTNNGFNVMFMLITAEMLFIIPSFWKCSELFLTDGKMWLSRAIYLALDSA